MERRKQWLPAIVATLALLRYDVIADVNASFVFMNSEGADVDVDTAGVVPAVDMALERINDAPDLLPGYPLDYNVVLNSECKRITSLDRFFTSITTPPSKVFLLGCGCGRPTIDVGVIAHFWEIVHMSYATQSPVIGQRDLYPTLYSTLPSAIGYVDIIMELMSYFDWKRLAIITVMGEEFQGITDTLETRLDEDDDLTGVIVTFRPSENISDVSLFNPDYRINFLNMHSRHARRVLCKAYNQNSNMRYPHYVWITSGLYPDLWWTRDVAGNDPSVPCSDDELMSMLEYSLVIDNLPTTDDEDGDTDVGMTTRLFMTQYSTAIQNMPLVGSSFAAPYAYDALWAMALAINSTNSTLPLQSFDNDQNASILTPEFQRNLDTMSFTGITGPVSFARGIRAQRRPRVLQYRSNNSTTISYTVIADSDIITNNSFTFMYVDNESDATTWPEIVPYDGAPLSDRRSVILPVTVIVYIGGVGVIVLAIGCAIVNFALRKRKVIRLTSPNLNYLIVLGSILLCVSALLYAFPTECETTLLALCYVRAYTQNIGYSFCFGTICAKMWRVYFIFANVTPNRKRRAIKDWQLLVGVLILVGIDVLYISGALGVDRAYGPVEVDYQELPPEDNEYGIEVQYKTLVCDSQRSIIWIAIIFIKHFCVQAAAVFFAIKTRKVKIRTLNDTKEVSIIIYVTSVVLTIMIIAVFALNNYLNADAAVYSSGLVLVSLLVLLLLFIPKWYQMYKDPKGEFIFERSNTSFGSGLGNGDVELTNEMKKRIEELETRLRNYEEVVPFSARKRLLSSGSMLAGDNNFARSLSNAPLIRANSNISPVASLPASIGRMPAIKETPKISPSPVFSADDSGIQLGSKSSKDTSESSSPKEVESSSPKEGRKAEEDKSKKQKLSFSDDVETTNF